MRPSPLEAYLLVNPDTAHNPVTPHHPTQQALPEVINYRTRKNHPRNGQNNLKQKCIFCPQFSGWTNVSACCTYSYNFVITKTTLSLTLAPYIVPCLKVSYAAYWQLNPQRYCKKCLHQSSQCRSLTATLCPSENKFSFFSFREYLWWSLHYTMGNILIGMSFFKKYSVTLHLKNNLAQLQFLELSLQLRLQHGSFKCGLFE